MTILQAVILGIVEGVTEFLPVSSTAHLIVVQKLMSLPSPTLFFDTVVQMGAVVAVLVYFWKELWQLGVETIVFLRDIVVKSKFGKKKELPNGLMLVVATVPVFIVGFLLRKIIAGWHDSITILAFSSIVVGLFLLLAQKMGARTENKATAREILGMGLWQLLALIPGVSRSGIVVAGGVMTGLGFAEALKYSFFLGIPALLGAGVFELFSSFKEPIAKDVVMMTAVATVVAFVAALFSIRGLLALVRRMGFTPFVIYRVITGVLLLLFF